MCAPLSMELKSATAMRAKARPSFFCMKKLLAFWRKYRPRSAQCEGDHLSTSGTVVPVRRLTAVGVVRSSESRLPFSG